MLKRKSFILYGGITILVFMIISLLPIGEREAGCPAQAQEQAPIVIPGASQPQPPSPPPPRTFPSRRDLYIQQQQQTPGTGASQPPAPGPAPSPEPATPADVTQAPPPVHAPSLPIPPASRKGLVTLNFDDADVYAIIQTIFGQVLKVNYVVDPRIKGRVTFRAVAPVPLESVLPLMEVIFRLNGIGVVEDNGLYRLVPISDISKEPSPISVGRDPDAIQATGKAMVQVVPVSYIPSAEMLKLITPFASTNAVLIDVPKSKQIIIVDTDANVKRLLRLVDVFDNENARRKKPDVFVYQVQNSKARDIATLLQQIFLGTRAPAAGLAGMPSTGGAYPSSLTASTGQTVLPTTAAGTTGAYPSSYPMSMPTGAEMLVSETTRIIPDEITNTIIILCTPEDYNTIKKAIEQIDIVPRQVVIEGVIASVQLIDNLSLGLGALFKGNIGTLNTTFGVNPGSLNVDPNGLTTTGFTFVGTDVAGAVRGLITALATASKAKLLATPHILVSDNREAKIQVGQQVPLVTSETYGVPGVAPQRSIQYRDIGIILKVKPRVNQGGLVSLELYQEVSTFSTVTLSGADQIILNKTDATTSVVVQNNQTIVIGGLIREDSSKARSGIPWLSQIPFLGWLFGKTDNATQRTELIILLTPHVVLNQQEAKDLSDGYINKMAESSKGGMKREEIIQERPQPAKGSALPSPQDSGAAKNFNEGGADVPLTPAPNSAPFTERSILRGIHK